MKKTFIIIGKIVAGILGVIAAILAFIGTGRVVEDSMDERKFIDGVGESLKKTKKSFKNWFAK